MLLKTVYAFGLRRCSPTAMRRHRQLRRRAGPRLAALAADLPASVVADLTRLHIHHRLAMDHLGKRNWAQFVAA